MEPGNCPATSIDPCIVDHHNPTLKTRAARRAPDGVMLLKDLSPSAVRVCDAAVGHFAEYGYDASSLNEIAQLAGMRKASLYAHFANKDALFVEVFQRALVQETAFIEHSFAQEGRDGLAPGHWLALHLADRYRDSAELRFVLRTAFLPPTSIQPIVTSGFEKYLDGIRERFCQALQARHGWADQQHSRLALYADAYQGIIDSLYVELMYAGAAAFERRAAALLKVLDDSLSLNR